MIVLSSRKLEEKIAAGAIEPRTKAYYLVAAILLGNVAWLVPVLWPIEAEGEVIADAAVGMLGTIASLGMAGREWAWPTSQ